MTLPPIEIVTYRPDWVAQFAAAGAELRHTLGDVALRIDHIGSTSVPGLAAKPRIDVQITAATLDAGTVMPLLEAVGYTGRADIGSDHCPPGMSLAEVDLAKLYAQRLEAPAVNCHVRVAGRFNQRYAILFRDYLRAHAAAAAAYGEVKRSLATRAPHDWDLYYDVKDPAIDMLMSGAEEWAQRTDWSPGPSDA
jgi:GrpB-like predicted nucleotidyltransferase (UPF0157 family)